MRNLQDEINHFFDMDRLPASADPEGIQAELKDGILSVKLPKKKEAIPKQITVKVN